MQWSISLSIGGYYATNLCRRLERSCRPHPHRPHASGVSHPHRPARRAYGWDGHLHRGDQKCRANGPSQPHAGEGLSRPHASWCSAELAGSSAHSCEDGRWMCIKGTPTVHTPGRQRVLKRMSWNSAPDMSNTKRPSSKSKPSAIAWMSCGQSTITSTGSAWIRSHSHPSTPSAGSQKMG